MSCVSTPATLDDRELSAGLEQGPLPLRLMDRFLLSWLGVWPGRGLLRVAPSARRVLPDPTGVVQPLVGVVAPHGVALSVPPLALPQVRRALHETAPGRAADLPALLEALPEALDRPGSHVEVRALAWTATPVRLRPAEGSSGLVRRVAHTPLGCELLLAASGDVRADGEALAREAGRVVAQRRIALFTHASGDLDGAATAAAAGLRAPGWQLLRLAPGAT